MTLDERTMFGEKPEIKRDDVTRKKVGNNLLLILTFSNPIFDITEYLGSHLKFSVWDRMKLITIREKRVTYIRYKSVIWNGLITSSRGDILL